MIEIILNLLIVIDVFPLPPHAYNPLPTYTVSYKEKSTFIEQMVW